MIRDSQNWMELVRWRQNNIFLRLNCLGSARLLDFCFSFWCIWKWKFRFHPRGVTGGIILEIFTFLTVFAALWFSVTSLTNSNRRLPDVKWIDALMTSIWRFIKILEAISSIYFSVNFHTVSAMSNVNVILDRMDVKVFSSPGSDWKMWNNCASSSAQASPAQTSFVRRFELYWSLPVPVHSWCQHWSPVCIVDICLDGNDELSLDSPMSHSYMTKPLGTVWPSTRRWG